MVTNNPRSNPADPTAAALRDSAAFLRDDVGALGATPPGSPGVHHKAPPVCLDRTLQSSAMTTESLAQLAFPSDTAAAVPAPDATSAALPGSAPTTTATTATTKAVGGPVVTQPSTPHHPTSTMVPTGVDLPLLAIPVSSSSSTCTRESDTLSDAEGGGGGLHRHHRNAGGPPADRAAGLCHSGAAAGLSCCRG